MIFIDDYVIYELNLQYILSSHKEFIISILCLKFIVFSTSYLTLWHVDTWHPLYTVAREYLAPVLHCGTWIIYTRFTQWHVNTWHPLDTCHCRCCLWLLHSILASLDSQQKHLFDVPLSVSSEESLHLQSLVAAYSAWQSQTTACEIRFRAS